MAKHGGSRRAKAGQSGHSPAEAIASEDTRRCEPGRGSNLDAVQRKPGPGTARPGLAATGRGEVAGGQGEGSQYGCSRATPASRLAGRGGAWRSEAAAGLGRAKVGQSGSGPVPRGIYGKVERATDLRREASRGVNLLPAFLNALPLQRHTRDQASARVTSNQYGCHQATHAC